MPRAWSIVSHTSVEEQHTLKEVTTAFYVMRIRIFQQGMAEKMRKTCIIQIFRLSLQQNYKTKMDGNQTERISQTSECGNESKSGILEDASTFAQRVLEEIEALAGTTTCKSVQLLRLKKWAQEHGCWFNDRTMFGDFFDRGSENEVYLDGHLYFIDTIIFKSGTGGFETYNSLSPRGSNSTRP